MGVPGVLDAGVPAVPDSLEAPDDGAAGFLAAPVLLSELVPEEDVLSPSDSVAPEHAATRHAKTTKPARAGSKTAFIGSTSGKGREVTDPRANGVPQRKHATKWQVLRADHGARVVGV